MKNFWLVALALLFVLKGKLLLRSYSMLYLQKQQTHQAEREGARAPPTACAI
jgi:hypothetical protein